MSDDKHEKAVELTEQALDAVEEGDESAAKKLVAEAKKLDPSAIEEVVHDLDEAAKTSVKPAD